MTNTSGNFMYDMRPPAGIMNVFSRLNYKPHYAIAEFVDNSTQSYFLHRSELRKSAPNFELHIVVAHDPRERTLTIEDNAFGMERERFLDAITLDAKNGEQQNSRNEFGMGLKTAASWFGNVWSVTSTAYGSSNRYTAVVDIPHFQESGESDIEIRVEPALLWEHGTTIRITQMTKTMGPRSIGKTRAMLASMYRRDLSGGEVRISVNGQDIVFEDYPILRFRDKEWRKDLDFSFEFLDKSYRITGFVGIMNPAGFPKSGFALFRRNRVIIGGEDQNYKPHEIFGASNSQVALKLFGELNVDDFPVNQAKDGFVWHDGLEDEFLTQLKIQIQDYISIARMSIKERTREEQYSDEHSERVEDEVSRAVENLNLTNLSAGDGCRTDDNDEVDDSPQSLFGGYNDVVYQFVSEMNEDNQRPSDFQSPERTYAVRLNDVTTRDIRVSWEIGSNTRWIHVVKNDDESLSVTINVNHPFFKPYSNEDEFQVVLEKFVIAFVVAEETAKLNSTSDGYIMASAIRGNMNRYLDKLSEG